MTSDELKAKLDDVGKRIEQTKNKLQLRGIFVRDHQITQEELDKRYQLLKSQLDKEVHSLEERHYHVNQLEQAFLKWMNAIDFDAQ